MYWQCDRDYSCGDGSCPHKKLINGYLYYNDGNTDCDSTCPDYIEKRSVFTDMLKKRIEEPPYPKMGKPWEHQILDDPANRDGYCRRCGECGARVLKENVTVDALGWMICSCGAKIQRG